MLVRLITATASGNASSGVSLEKAVENLMVEATTEALASYLPYGRNEKRKMNSYVRKKKPR